MTRVLRCAVVGLGKMGAQHARVLATFQNVQVVAFIDEAGDEKQLAPGTPVYRDIEALESIDIDFAIISTPTSTHAVLADWLIDRKIHLLVEKPLTADYSSASRLATKAEERGCVAAVGHIERYNPAVRELKSQLEAGVIGEVFQIQTRRQGPFSARITDVGVTKDLATHDFDASMWATGCEYSHVYGQITYRSGRESEDLVLVSGQLSNGVLINHVVNWLSPVKERLIIVSGTSGTLVADTLLGDLTLHRNGEHKLAWESLANFRGVSEGSSVKLAFPKIEPLRLELEAFVEAVSGTGQDFVSFRQGALALKVADAALESARTNAVISL